MKKNTNTTKDENYKLEQAIIQKEMIKKTIINKR